MTISNDKITKLEVGGTGYVTIDGSPHQKGSLWFDFSGDTLEIKFLGNYKILVTRALFSQFQDSTNTPFASITELKTFVQTNCFQA